MLVRACIRRACVRTGRRVCPKKVGIPNSPLRENNVFEKNVLDKSVGFKKILFDLFTDLSCSCIIFGKATVCFLYTNLFSLVCA